MYSKFELLYRLKIIRTLFDDKRLEDSEVKERMETLLNQDQLKILSLSWDMEPRFRRNILKMKLEEEIHELTQELFAYPCNKRWDSLQNTDNQDVKYCIECRKNVYLASDEKELRKRQELKQCIHFRPKISFKGVIGHPITGIRNYTE